MSWHDEAVSSIDSFVGQYRGFWLKICASTRRPSRFHRQTGQVCGGYAKVIAWIEDSVVIRKILNHLQEKSSLDSVVRLAKLSAGSAALDAKVRLFVYYDP